MKKLYFTLLILALSYITSFSQDANYYIFSAGSGATLDPMIGAATIVPAGTDNDGSELQTIPFTFVYESRNYTQFAASPNGLMKLGDFVPATSYANSITTGGTTLLFPFWDDLATGADGSVSFVVSGAAPNRILKVQWFVTVPKAVGGAANSIMQAWLYETTNVIEFRYGIGAGPASGASIGISGRYNQYGNDHYISVSTPANTASTTNANNFNNAWPGTGTKYAFTPPAVSPCNIPDQATSVSITAKYQGALGGYINASGTAPSGYLVVRSMGAFTGTPVNGTEYLSGDVIGNGTVVQSAHAGTTGYTAEGLQGNTQYTITVLSYNEGLCSGGPVYNTTSPPSKSDVTCVDRPTASATNVAPTSATINWTSSLGGGAVTPITYTVTVATDNSFASPVAGFPVTVNDPTTTLNVSGLTPGTTYYYQVTASGSCPLSGATALHFTTNCTPTDAPYVENFDEATVPALPACTLKEDLNPDPYTSWTTVNGVSGYTGNVAKYSASSFYQADDWIYTRGVSLTAGTSYTLGYKYGNDPKGYTDYDIESMNVKYGNSPSASAMTNLLANHSNFRLKNPAINSVAFTPSATGVYYFGFNAYSQGGMYYIYLDSISVTESSILPVSLTTFNAARNGVVNNISWVTAQEINTSMFVIERSSDGRNFKKIGEAAAAGNSDIARTYQFTDVSPSNGTNYYRLRIIDRDDNAKFSDVKSIKNTGIAYFTLYPVPAKDVVKVDVNVTKADRGVMTVTDINGRQVYSRTVNVATGNNTFSVDLSNIERGTYIIKIHLSDEILVNKITKM